MIRTLIAAIENAEAVEAQMSVEPRIGLNHDEPRFELSDDDVAAIVARERTEIAEALARYRELGLVTESADLEQRLAIVDRYVEPAS